MTVSVVFGATDDPKVRRLMDQCSGPGVRTGVGGPPETRAEVDISEIGRN